MKVKIRPDGCLIIYWRFSMKVNSLLFLTLLACAVSMVAQERKADESVERKTTKEQDEAMAAQQAQLRALAFQNYELARAGLSQ